MSEALLNPEALSATAGLVLSLVMTYVPGLNVKFALLSSTAKRLIMLVCLAITAVGSAAWICTQPAAGMTFGMCMSGFDWRSVITAFVMALMANQAADRIMPKPAAVEEAREESHRKAEQAA